MPVLTFMVIDTFLGSTSLFSQEEFLQLDSIVEVSQELALSPQYVSGNYSYFYDDSDSINLIRSVNQIIKIGNISLVIEGAGNNMVSFNAQNRIDEISIKLDDIILLAQDELLTAMASNSYLSRKAWYATEKANIISKNDEYISVRFKGQTDDANEWRIFYRIELQYFSYD